MVDRDNVFDDYPALKEYTAPLKSAAREIVGREEEVKKLMAAMARPELCNCILIAEAGSGKCLINNSLIPVNDGRKYVKIQDLKIGDYVFDENGEPTLVTGVFPQGLQHAYKVKFLDGTSIICNDEHLWNVRTKDGRYKKKEFKTRTLREMIDIGIRDNQGASRWSIPVGHAVEWPEVDLPIHPYALGALIGDGSLRERALVISSDDKWVVEKVAALLDCGLVYQNKSSYSWYFVNNKWLIDGSGNKCLTSNELKDLLPDDQEVFGFKSIHRRIPEMYLTASKEQRLELLRGLMDTDGGVNSTDRTQVRFSTNNAGLKDDVLRLLYSLGYRASWTEDIRKEDGLHENPEYTVFIKGTYEDKLNVFSLERHKETLRVNYRHDKKFNRSYEDLHIVEVEDLGVKEEMTCIKVAAPSELFQAGQEHIVTHNTALVQKTMLSDHKRFYVEVDLEHMLTGLEDVSFMAERLKQLFKEAEAYAKAESLQVVFFIDEFHRLIQLSEATVEAIKPVLAESGVRGLRIIAATTNEEFHKFVAPNQPLVERLQRINLPEPDRKTTIAILRGMARQYGVENQFLTDEIFEQIYDITTRYIPSQSQPRKSIRMLDSMLGWKNAFGNKMDRQLLADVILDSENVNIAFRVDALSIQQKLDAHVISQKLATRVLTERLQLCIAGLNDASKPMSSFLFCGSTGVGKGIPITQRIPIYNPENDIFWKKMGEVEVGDMTFDREGKPTKILGVFPQGLRDTYTVKFSDGRSLVTDGPHLWGVYPYFTDRNRGLTVLSTETIYSRMQNDGPSTRARYSIPMNKAVEWPRRVYKTDPYIMGSFIADGCMTDSVPALTIASDDEFIVSKISRILGTTYKSRKRTKPVVVGKSQYVNYSWVFQTDKAWGKNKVLVQKNEYFSNYPEVCTYSGERRIPTDYMTGSVEQRWDLVKGLFDSDGHIGSKDGGRYNVSYATSSRGLAYDIQQLLYSLGVSSTIGESIRNNGQGSESIEYIVRVKSDNIGKSRFFSLPRKLELVEIANSIKKSRKYDYDFIDIVSITKNVEQEETVCIYVDNDEHLFQVGDFIVTHNTEITKELASLLFGDARRHLIRFDMTEYTTADSAPLFKSELSRRVKDRAFSVILLDEIEKAHKSVTRALLPVLDDGRMNDDYNREVSFLNTYIVMTTNAGSEVYKTIGEYMVDEEGSGEQINKYMKVIRRSLMSTTSEDTFPQELLGRIDCIIPFQPLSLEAQREILNLKLRSLRKDIRRKHGVYLDVHPKVLQYLVDDKAETSTEAGGARGAIRILTDEVVTSIAAFINANPNEKSLYVDIEGELASDNENLLYGDAHIVVKAMV